MSIGHVTSISADQITTITFYHPAHNAMPSHLLSELVSHIDRAGIDSNSNIIILRSEGERTFCAGASLDELASIDNQQDATQFFLGFANVINAIRKSPKIIISRIQGKAVGGGVGIAAACDYSMATIYATIKLSELSIGIGPFVIGPAVERKIGLSAFSQMALNATEWQTAAWAKQKGLFTEVFDTTTQLDEYIAHFSKNLANKSPDALAQLKAIFWEGTAHWDALLKERANITGSLLLTPSAKNAIHGFLQA